ncbi:hypothetical protein [Burkholderia ubonensis]|uniref:hypothetical protein n=1 Tax=Burkholderia ubonensis TaxID=101571 RepID=UPI0012FB096F|nr:hypothetical protein [Burkholderia ubonensis]
MNTANRWQLLAKSLCIGAIAASSLTACGKSPPAPTLNPATFGQRYFRPNPPDWAKVTVSERHFLLSSQQMYRSNLASVYFHSFDECQANLRNYSAWQAQGDINRSGQTFVHTLAVDQYTDNSPALGPELVTLQCVDLWLKPHTPVPTPDFSDAEKVAETPVSQSELPSPQSKVGTASSASKGAVVERKPTTYVDPQESGAAKDFDAQYNSANQQTLYPIVLGVSIYDIETRKIVRAGATPYHFNEFSDCWGNVINYLSLMTPYSKTVAHRPERLAVYGQPAPDSQYVGRDPQSQRMVLVIPQCVQRTADHGYVEDPKRPSSPPAFELARRFVSLGMVK